MARRIGLLSVSMAALGLALTAYVAQGASAVEPVAVADFGAPQAAVAQVSDGDEYDTGMPASLLLHPAAAASKPACTDGAGIGTIAVNDEVAILCKDGALLGFLVTEPGEDPRLVKSLPGTDTCPSAKTADKIEPNA